MLPLCSFQVFWIYSTSFAFYVNFMPMSAKKKKKTKKPKKHHRSWDFDKDYIESVSIWGNNCHPNKIKYSAP